VPLCWAAAGLAFPVATHAQGPSAEQVLARATRWIGVPAREGLAGIRADIEAFGPPGRFRVLVLSAGDGRRRMEQHFPAKQAFVAGVGRGGPWRWSAAAGAPDSLDPVTLSVVTGHEYHQLVLDPLSRFTQPRLVPTAGDTSFRVEFTDPLGGTPAIVYAPSGQPLELEVINHTGEGPRTVRVRLADWETSGGLRLFRRAELVHGEAHWYYRYTRVIPRPLPDEAFEPSSRWLDSTVPSDRSRMELQAILQAQARAHFDRDPRTFLTARDSGWIRVNGGVVTWRSLPAARESAEAWFGSVAFDSLVEVVPPWIELSRGGDLATVLAHYRITGRHDRGPDAGTPVRFETAWLDVYRREGETWLLLTSVNTDRPLE